MSTKSWTVPEFDRAAAVKLCRSGINPLTAVVLASRGIDSAEEIELLTGDGLSLINDPYLLDDMDKAVSRIEAAISTGEHIAVYGDYDVDGITSTTVLTEYLRSRGAKCDFFIPERLTDGYGVKAPALKRLRDMGASLVITVDCGITASAEAEYAKKLGLDMIITDHHKCPETLPSVIAVIDPGRPDGHYPFSSLAGVGVAFKLICAMEKDTDVSELLDRFGGIVALGTVADVMPVTYENRAIIKRGLKRLSSTGNLGIKCLCRAAGTDPDKITVTNMGFILAPRLNAAGRLGATDYATELLMTRDERRAEKCAAELCRLNRERQQLESELVKDAVAYLDKHPAEGRPVVIASESWHQGVAGIAASRLAEKYSVPAVVICVSEGLGRGSCRSFGDFNIFAGLEYCAGVLEGFGGHDMAAGLTVREENIPALREKLGEYYISTGGAREPALHVDYEVVKPGLLTVQNVTALDMLEPYGVGNPSPLLCIKGAEISCVSAVGGGRHTKFRASKFGESYDCIFFSKTPAELRLSDGDRADIAFLPQVSEFRGRRSVQLLINDLRHA